MTKQQQLKELRAELRFSKRELKDAIKMTNYAIDIEHRLGHTVTELNKAITKLRGKHV